MRPVETVLRKGGREIRKNEEGGESNTYCKYLFKCHNVSMAQL
jgi:hypothetical protein